MIDDLYQEVILDHSRKPRNFSPLNDASHTAEGYNPLCGDRCKLFVKQKDGVIENISFQGSGCAISTSSASIMTEALKGKSVEEAESMLREFLDMVTKDQPEEHELGKLAVFSGVREYPARVKCATLAWHTLRAALRNSGEVTSTE